MHPHSIQISGTGTATIKGTTRKPFHPITLNCACCQPVAVIRNPKMVKRKGDIIRWIDYRALKAQQPSEWHSGGMIICRACYSKMTREEIIQKSKGIISRVSGLLRGI